MDGIVDYKEQFKGEDIFAVVERNLYKEYPQYLEKNNIFLQKGVKISRFKTIKENAIENDIPIVMAIVQEKERYSNKININNNEINNDMINNNNNIMMNNIINNNMQINENNGDNLMNNLNIFLNNNDLQLNNWNMNMGMQNNNF